MHGDNNTKVDMTCDFCDNLHYQPCDQNLWSFPYKQWH